MIIPFSPWTIFKRIRVFIRRYKIFRIKFYIHIVIRLANGHGLFWTNLWSARFTVYAKWSEKTVPITCTCNSLRSTFDNPWSIKMRMVALLVDESKNYFTLNSFIMFFGMQVSLLFFNQLKFNSPTCFNIITTGIVKLSIFTC